MTEYLFNLQDFSNLILQGWLVAMHKLRMRLGVDGYQIRVVVRSMHGWWFYESPGRCGPGPWLAMAYLHYFENL
jgi:hypothetical protein